MTVFGYVKMFRLTGNQNNTDSRLKEMPTETKVPGKIHKIKTIAGNTFREAVRDRILYNLVFFVLLITAAAVFLGELTAGHEARTIVGLGLAAMLFFGTFIAIFVGVGLVSKEIEKRTVYTIFSKPVTRGEFVIGKYLGLCLTLLVNVAVMGVGVSLALLFVGNSGLALTVWGAILLLYFELALMTAVAILFSTFSSPALSAILAFLIFVIGHFSASLQQFGENLGSQAASLFFDFLYYVLPNFSHFSFASNAVHGGVPAVAHLGWGFGYAAVYAAMLLSLATVIFSYRNFK